MDELTSAIEVLTVGRVGVDLYPQQSGVPLVDVTTFAKFLIQGMAFPGLLLAGIAASVNYAASFLE